MREPNDIYQYFRVEESPFACEGRPFFLTVLNDSASVISHSWGLSFSTYESACEGAYALIASGRYYKVYINEQRRALRRA